MKKSFKRIEIIGIISLVLLFTAFNFRVFVSAQDGNRDRVIQPQNAYTVEITAKTSVSLRVMVDNGRIIETFASPNGKAIVLNPQNNIWFSYYRALGQDLLLKVNGKPIELPSTNPNNPTLNGIEVFISKDNYKEILEKGKLPKSAFPTKTPKSNPNGPILDLPTTPEITTPTPRVTPTNTPTPPPVSTPVPIQTLPELQSKIRISLSRPELRRGTVAIKIVSLDSGKILYEENAEKYVMPASNMKSYTIATAMEKLTPNFRIVTSVYAGAMPDTSGVIKGDLTIYGRGDISMAMAFADPNANANVVYSHADYLKVLEPLANKIVQAGVKRIEGNLVGDESYFNSEPLPSGWEWDDLQWYYGAEISALSVLDNAVDLSVRPGSLNSPCSVQVLPTNTLFTVVNRCVTNASGNRRDLQVVKKLDRNILEITGTMPVGDRGFTGYVTVTRPAQLFVEMLRQLLQQKGITITGQNRVIGAKDKAMTVATTVAPVEITRLESPPLSLIAARTMKPSQNMYAETVLRVLGEQLGDKSNPKTTSEDRGVAVVKNFLTQVGIAPDSVIQHDGSGLSRHDLITAASNVQLYSYMARSPNAQAWRDSLTIGAVDGTLRSRFSGTPAANNVRGKTGTIDQVSALTGYVTTMAGEQLVFSIVVNGVNSGSARTATMDEIVVALSNFNGKVN